MSKFSTPIDELNKRDAKARIVHLKTGVSYLEYRRRLNPRVNND